MLYPLWPQQLHSIRATQLKICALISCSVQVSNELAVYDSFFSSLGCRDDKNLLFLLNHIKTKLEPYFEKREGGKDEKKV